MKNKNILNFPVGFYEDLHKDFNINFQMNRFYNWTNDSEMLTEMRNAGAKIQSYEDFIKIFIELSQKALHEDKRLKAAYYLRGAEFYMTEDNPMKQPARKQFISLLREHYNIKEDQHFNIPYENGFLSAYHFTTENPKGTIVLFGGFDSYIEELFPMAFAMQTYGYEVVCFDGPGQGSALEDSKLPLTHEWEKPTKAILDFFNLEDVTLVGISLGGYFAVRAAAFEKRIKRVITDDICADFYQVLLKQINPNFRESFQALMETEDAEKVNALFEQFMQNSMLLKWGIMQGMHITGSQTPHSFMKAMMCYNTKEISSMLHQDVLLLAGQEDHYIPLNQLFEQSQALTNVRSLTTRIFTKKETAQNHCHIGNIGLSFEVILNWIEDTTK